MYTREALSLDECQAAIAAIIGEWKKDSGQSADNHGHSRP